MHIKTSHIIKNVYILINKSNYDSKRRYREMKNDRPEKNKWGINRSMTPDNEIYRETNEHMTERDDQKMEKKDRFLPIFFWTDWLSINMFNRIT